MSTSGVGDGGLDDAIASIRASRTDAGADAGEDDEKRLTARVHAAAKAFARVASQASLPADEVVVDYRDSRFRKWTRDRAWRAGGGLQQRPVVGMGWVLRRYRRATPRHVGQSSVTVTSDGKLLENAEWRRDCRLLIAENEAEAEELVELIAAYLIDHGLPAP